MIGAVAGLMAEMTQHYVQPLEILTRGVPVRQTIKEIASKIRSGRLGTGDKTYKYAVLSFLNCC